MSGKTRSARFAYDDEKIINRKIDGIKEYFGKREVSSIKTYDIRDYLSVLDENRKKPLSPSSKKKHTTIIAKILKVAYEKEVIDKLPIIPNVSIKDNPRPSFNDKEYSLLLKTTRDEISKGSSVRGIVIKEEFYYFIVFMTHSFLRPTESEIINGEINNRTTINKNEAGVNESLTVNAQAQDTVVNVIEDTLVRFYEVTKQEIFITNSKSYRVYVMIEVSKKDIDKIIAEINKRNLAVIDVDEINKRANEVLNNKG